MMIERLVKILKKHRIRTKTMTYKLVVYAE